MRKVKLKKFQKSEQTINFHVKISFHAYLTALHCNYTHAPPCLNLIQFKEHHVLRKKFNALPKSRSFSQEKNTVMNALRVLAQSEHSFIYYFFLLFACHLRDCASINSFGQKVEENLRHTTSQHFTALHSTSQHFTALHSTVCCS